MSQIKIDIIIPTYKPDKSLFTLIDSLEAQTIPPTGIIIMNTEEKYINNLLFGTDFLKKHPKVRIKNIAKREFNHGRTRNEGAKRSDARVIVFMTQDAFPENDHLIEELIRPLTDKDVAVSYARQVASEDASPLEVFSRNFNYPDEDMIKGEEDKERLGIKTYFCSNVCAAYKKYVFDELGGFVNYTIFNEDMLFAAKAVRAGKKIAYASRARVIHSHDYSGRQQFKRNFDLGVSQADHPEVFEELGSENEGIRLVKGTAEYLLSIGKPLLIPRLVWQSFCKFRGYRLGKKYKKLSKKKILRCTMNPTYWRRYWDHSEIPENVYAGYGKSEKEG
ncbi:MAG: glycosyltransferase family 2 protein [Lachnospiraceae bacterium]|nr:glycosyltransferase family 2 protein [Lachnospiraceae bacterium]